MVRGPLAPVVAVRTPSTRAGGPARESPTDGTWYRLLEVLLLSLPPVIGVGVVGLLAEYPDPRVGRLLLALASAAGVLIRVGVPVCVLMDARRLRRQRLWRPRGDAYALGALVLSAPVFGLLYLYRRHDRVPVAPGWDGWWVLVAASLGGALSGVPIALLAYVLALPPLVVAVPALAGGLTLAAFPVGIYRDAVYLRNSGADWRPNPALYLALAFVSLLLTVLQPPVAAYYLYRRQGVLPVRG